MRLGLWRIRAFDRGTSVILGSNLALYILSSWVMMCGHNRRIGAWTVFRARITVPGGLRG